FIREVNDLIRFNAKVTAIQQDTNGVTVVYEDTTDPGKPLRATADWCLCTIPLPILSQIKMTVGAPMQNAIDAVPYAPALKDGLRSHPQDKDEFENGIAVAWHRNPSVLGCEGTWTDDTRKQHYQNLCAIDGRILLAGEHASYWGGWQEGAILSSLDAIARLHRRVLAG